MPSHPGLPPIEPLAAAGGPCGPGPPADHRRGPRRRGQLLFEAIFEATVAELAETGYAGLAMERIAARARTSKASLYRRWPSRADLVVDAIRHCSPELSHPPDTGNLREDLLSLLRGMATGSTARSARRCAACSPTPSPTLTERPPPAAV